MMHHVTQPYQRTVVTKWLAARQGMTVADMVHTYDYEILACVRHRELIGAVLFLHHQGRNIEAHWAGETGWLSRRHVKEIFAYPFQTLGVHRVTTIVPAQNKLARDVVERLGFTREGVLREATDTGEDLELYGMLRHECRGVPARRVKHGQDEGADVRRQSSGCSADFGQSRLADG